MGNLVENSRVELASRLPTLTRPSSSMKGLCFFNFEVFEETDPGVVALLTCFSFNSSMSFLKARCCIEKIKSFSASARSRGFMFFRAATASF